MSESTPRPWRVMKFGGVSVADPARWTTIAELAKQRLKSGDRVLIVHSALAGVSNALEALPAAALNGQGDAEATAIAPLPQKPDLMLMRFWPTCSIRSIA